MANQPNNAGGAGQPNQSNTTNPAANRGQTPNAPASKTPSTAPANKGTTGTPGREGVDAPRAEKGTPAGRPASTYEDRPSQQREGGDAQKTPGRGTPDYGDTEPNDPRKLDVDAGTGGRRPSGDTTKRP